MRFARIAAVAALALVATSTAAAHARPDATAATAAASGARAHAWNFDAAAPLNTWYALTSAYSANSTGGTNHAKRNGTGWYTVWFPGVPAVGSTVHVTAYGSDDAYCTVQGWYTPNGISGTDVEVRCFTRTGAPANSRFTISQAHQGSGTGAYVWVNTSGTPALGYQHSSTGATTTVTWGGNGVYTVRMPGLGGSGGHVQVTGYAADGRWCKAGGWGPSGGAQHITVRCFTAAGVPVNTMFTLTYVENTNILLGPATTPSAYAWVSPTGGVSAAYAYDTNPNGSTSVQTVPPGGYKVRFPVDLSGGLAHVTAYGGGNERCKLAYWTPADGVTIDCYRPDGTYANAYSDVAFVG